MQSSTSTCQRHALHVQNNKAYHQQQAILNWDVQTAHANVTGMLLSHYVLGADQYVKQHQCAKRKDGPLLSRAKLVKPIKMLSNGAATKCLMQVSN